MLMADAVALPVMLWTAYALRFGNLFPPIEDVWLFPLTVLVGLPALYLLGFYRSIVRYLGAEVAWSVVLGMTATVVVLASLSYMVPAMVPRSVFLIFWALGVLYLGSSRFWHGGSCTGLCPAILPPSRWRFMAPVAPEDNWLPLYNKGGSCIRF